MPGSRCRVSGVFQVTGVRYQELICQASFPETQYLSPDTWSLKFSRHLTPETRHPIHHLCTFAPLHGPSLTTPDTRNPTSFGRHAVSPLPEMHGTRGARALPDASPFHLCTEAPLLFVLLHWIISTSPASQILFAT